MPHIRVAKHADLPRIHAIRRGTHQNELLDPARVTDSEVAWYMDEAIFLVSVENGRAEGFACANHQTGLVWALFVSEDAQGRGHGTALLDETLAALVREGHRQAFLSTGPGTRAAAFYRERGWRSMGLDLTGEEVFVHALGF